MSGSVAAWFLGTDNPTPKPSTSRRRQREDLDLLFREKEEEAKKEKYRKLLDRFFEEKEEHRKQEVEQEGLRRTLAEKEKERQEILRALEEESASSSSGFRPHPPDRPPPDPLQRFFDNRPGRKITRGERRAAKRTQQYLSAQRARKWAGESDAETEAPPQKKKRRKGGRKSK